LVSESISSERLSRVLADTVRALGAATDGKAKQGCMRWLRAGLSAPVLLTSFAPVRPYQSTASLSRITSGGRTALQALP
jgi:hypothetical protein